MQVNQCAIRLLEKPDHLTLTTENAIKHQKDKIFLKKIGGSLLLHTVKNARFFLWNMLSVVRETD